MAKNERGQLARVWADGRVSTCRVAQHALLLEEVRVLARDLAYHRRARLEAVLGRTLDEVDRQIEELRREEGRG